MRMFSDQELLHFNRLGLIPGPNESADDFTIRANYCLTLKDHLSEEFKICLGPVNDDPIDTLNNGFELVAKTYDISPAWIPIFFSNYRLPPWHGGCAWIFQMNEESPTACLLQLRQSLKKSSKYLGIYHRDELVSHELAHVGRMQFEEPRFEEILAYRTSGSAFRRYFGPIVQTSYESMVFVLTLAFIVFVDVVLLTFYNYNAYLFASWLKGIPIGMFCFVLVRLWSCQRQFNKCLSLVQSCLPDPSKALSVLYRLTDREIERFSKMTPEDIKAYALKNAEASLRWQLIQKTYFKHIHKA